MRIHNLTRDTELATQAKEAKSFFTRLIGLLGRGSLRPGEGLVIKPCNSVHTAFMRFAIDVVYVDRGDRVVKVAPKMKPFRASAVMRPPCSVIELPSGTIEETATAAGDQLAFES